ncbi:MAG: fumarylacetoacetate hydrolase family protein [Gammaproteobacteria bacterium]|nr:fumarylacetoacetate hydrolase family protein [Gammaproteobacteria bacterium]
MKIVSFEAEGEVRFGLLEGETIIDAQAASAGADGATRRLFADAIAFIRGGESALGLARDLLHGAPAAVRRPLAGTKLRAPIMPTTIVCSGSNYRAHVKEKENTPISGKEPEFFIKTSDCVVGPGDAIIHDETLTKKLDCETELAIVIGKPGRHIPRDRALEHVFGYTIVNDVTARDRQVRRSPQGFTWYELGRGKCFDTSAPLGPCIVTRDEIPDPQALLLETRINGELRQSSSTGEMIWTCADLVAFFSVNFTLRPGMVIITGTPAGTAWSTDKELGGKWEPAPGLIAATRYCLPGDEIESSIERIGVLRNRVAAYVPTEP